MPKLLVFVPCEKVIISQDENNPTLVAILQQVGGHYESPDNPPSGVMENFMIPMRWNVFSLWRREPSDFEQTFVQVFRIKGANGDTVVEAATEFRMEKATQRITAQLPGIAVNGGSGTWQLELFVHEKGAQLPEEPVGCYPLDVNFVEKLKAPR